MKVFKNILFASVALVLAYSCEDYAAFEPEVNSVKVTSQTTEGEGAIIEIQISAKAENVTIWWGDDDSNYYLYQDLIAKSDTGKNYTATYPNGETFNDDKFWDGITEIPHTYDTLGIYKLVVIASSNGKFSEENLQTKFELDLNVNP